MDLQSHKRTLSIIHICYGALYTLIFLFVASLFSTILPFIETAIIEEQGGDAWILPIIDTAVKAVLFFLFLFVALPSMIGGIATLQHKRWGMIFLMIAGCLSIFSFPIGTAIGVYTIYVFIEDNKKEG